MAAHAAPEHQRRLGRLGLALLLAALLAACGSAPKTPSASASDAGVVSHQRDGPPANPPADLIDRPDPEPRVEAIRTGGPNKPYVVLGQAYTPLASDEPVIETGLASWYGRKFHGRPTANGEIFDMYAMTAAHRTMPLPSYALVRNPANGREVVVRINDRGPFHSERIIDLSYAAALKLGVLRGVAPVAVQRLTHEEIRTGRWRRDAAPLLAAAPAAMPVPVTVPADLVLPVAARQAELPMAASAPAPPPELTGDRKPLVDAPGYWVQLGAFRQRQGANELRQQMTRELAWLEPWLAIFDDSTVYRLQAGPFASRSEAQGTAERIRDAARLQPMVVLRP